MSQALAEHEGYRRELSGMSEDVMALFDKDTLVEQVTRRAGKHAGALGQVAAGALQVNT